jgi:protein TonB
MPNSRLETRNQSQLHSGQHPARAQRNRMLLAAGLLLVAIAVVLFRDHAQDIAAPATSTQPKQDASVNTSESNATVAAPGMAATTARKRITADNGRAARATSAVAHTADIADAGGGPSITATRAVLPPLNVEVVAGDHHRMVKPGNPSMNVQMREQASLADEPQDKAQLAQNEAAPLQPASESVHMSADTALAHNVPPSYPLLAQKMKVQGSVVLEALIGKDGGIQDLKVVQGPSILADAAREAVRQWRFKPYLQDGAAVETLARITVNFQISTN